MDDERVGYSKDKAREAKNKALRCAISKAFNWPERIDRFYYGIGEAYPGVIAPGIDGYDPNLSRESVTYDEEGAKKLLKDNGWTAANLPDIEYGGVSGVTTKQFFEQFRGWMRKIGYPIEKIKFKPYATFGDFSKAMKERKSQFHGLGWAIDYPDSENILQLWYGPNEAPGSNTANFKHPEYDKLYEMASVMQPGPERTKLYQRMNKILVDECVVIAGFSRTGIWVWHKDVIMYPDRDVIGGFLAKYYGLESQLQK
jgi:ABC-type transport system substrate-binding protein